MDERINFDPSTHAYYEGQREAVKSFEVSQPVDVWPLAIDPIVVAIVGLAGRQPALPVPADERLGPELMVGWNALEQSVRDPDAGALPRSAATQVLCQRVGEALAERVASDSDMWFEIFKLELPYELLRAFCASLPREAVAGVQDRLCLLAKEIDPTDAMDSFEKWNEQVLRKLLEREMEASSERNAWGYVLELERFCDTFHSRSVIAWLRQLAVRGGAECFVAWISSLQHPLLKMALLGEVRDPDVLEGAMAAWETTADIDPLLGIMIAVELTSTLEAIDHNLSHTANWDWGAQAGKDTQTEQYREELRSWRDDELPRRVDDWCKVATSASHSLVAMEFVRNTFLQRWRADIEPSHVRATMRESVLIRLCAVHGVDEVAKRLLEIPVTSGALLGAAMATHQSDQADDSAVSAHVRVIAAYGDVDEAFFGGRPHLQDDNLQLAWLIAGTLAALPDPAGSWGRIHALADIPSEGWIDRSEDRAQSHAKLSHAFVVGAMAVEWLHVHGSHDQAVALFECVWDEVHRWSRLICATFDWEVATTPLVQVWARLALVHQADCQGRALQRLKEMDRVSWLVNCIGTLAANLSPQGVALDAAIRSSLGTRFETLRVTWERGSLDEGVRESTLARIHELVGATAG